MMVTLKLASLFALAGIATWTLHEEADEIADVFRTSNLLLDESRALLPPPASSFTTQSMTSRISKSPSTARDWFNATAWEQNPLSSQCFYVEDICFSHNRWFYQKSSSETDNSNKNQPNLTLNYWEIVPGQYGKSIRMMDNDIDNRENLDALQCQMSALPNHLVMQSYFNHMLGEFYDRSLLRLFEMLQSLHQQQPQPGDGSGNSFDSFMTSFKQQTQLYLHFYAQGKSLLDSHSLFTKAFRSHPLLDFEKTVADATSCQCLPRLIFCGYKVAKEDHHPEEPRDDSDSKERSMRTAAVTLTPNQKLTDSPRPKHSPLYDQMRQFLRTSIMDRSPFLSRDIAAYRDTILKQNGIRPDQIDRAEYKIVGLTQRTSRRRWRNLEKVMMALQRTFRLIHKCKLVFVKVNVEDPEWNAYQQVVRHGALDALVGIHGAQLTHAIWMKPGSLVVELLPYVPPFAGRGQWTTTTHTPTPLGSLFDRTDLIHVGVPLQRDSAPYCEGEVSQRCWDLNAWDCRDFVTAPSVVENVVRAFLADPPRTCEDYQAKSGPTDSIQTSSSMVVYNAPCTKSTDQQLQKQQHRSLLIPQSFYWKAPSRS